MQLPSEITIAVIEGTAREQRQSIHVAELISEVGAARDEVTSVLVDPVKFDLPGDGNDPEAKDPQFTKITQEADAFIAVIPEYNHSFPGTLKRIMDSELKNYIHKPIAFAGVSAGPWGGVRAIESFVPVVREYGLIASFADIQFPKVNELFDDSGSLVAEEVDTYTKRINRALDELLWLARLLKLGRTEFTQD